MLKRHDLLHEAAQQGIRLTAQRRALIETIQEAKSHLDAESLLQLARKRDPNIDRATVYRTIELLKRRLIARATVVTPNIPEAEILSGRRIADLAAMKEAASALRQAGPRVVVITGGHLAGPSVCDVICDADGIQVLEAPRLAGTSTHGTIRNRVL